MAITVLVIDRQRLVREALSAVLAAEPDIEVVGQAGDGAAAARLVLVLVPDVVVMDLDVPCVGCFETTRPVVVLVAERRGRTADAASRVGATSHLSKRGGGRELSEAVRAAASGPGLRADRPQMSGWKIDLSARESDVVRRVADGMGTKEIARSLRISTKTVETHRRNAKVKLDIHSVAGLTKFAIREGMTTA